MAIFIAVAALDPARNELTQAFVRSTQEDAEAMAAANAKANQPWVVYELVECASAVIETPKLTRVRQPAPRPQAGGSGNGGK